MLIRDSEEIEAKWIGGRIANTELNIPGTLANRTTLFYRKCIFGPLTLRIGDFVLVSNADAPEPDCVAGCDVARIQYLYELHDLFDKYPYRAIVQWYSRPNCIPHKEFDSDDILLDFDSEVVEEHRPYDNDISLDTIVQKCAVICGNQEDCARTLLHNFEAENNRYTGPRFACRYKYTKAYNRKLFQLMPLHFEEPVVATKERKSVRRTASATKNKDKTPTLSRRRASTSTARSIEFVDMGDFGLSKVSPIKIIGGRSVVRLSASVKKTRIDELLVSPLAERNARVTPPIRTAARRNLQLSLDREPNISADSDCLNYSIVGSTVGNKHQTAGEIKIKLRISERQRAPRLDSQDGDPLQVKKDVEGCDGAGLQPTRKRLGVAHTSTPQDAYQTPKKSKESTEVTPSKRRKSILKSASRRLDEGTPRRSIQLSNIVEKRIFQEDAIIATPKTTRKRNIDDDATHTIPRRRSTKQSHVVAVADAALTPSMKMKLIRSGEITANLQQRPQDTGIVTPKTDLQLAREQLHVAVVPQSLPCREKEFQNIYNFLAYKIQDECGGCMYVSGVPGTGKTATATSVIRALQAKAAQHELPEFEFLEINGMRLTEPRQAYVQIYKQLTGKTVSWEHAYTLLDKRFTTPAPRRITTVLLVDELDILCNRRQDVVYNLLDWPTKSAARLVVVTIANTMDLPERLLMGKVTSRLGLTRLTFQPYTYKQLEAIVVARLSGSEAFKGEAVQLVARKVASVSGDARRALDICRRATELADAASTEVCVSIAHVQHALAEMIASAKVQAIKSCSRLEQMFLRSVVAEVTRTGVEETLFMGIYTQMESIAAFEGVNVPTPGRCLRICAKLGSERLLICEKSRNDIFQKILLNVSTDDVHYALQLNNCA